MFEEEKIFASRVFDQTGGVFKASADRDLAVEGCGLALDFLTNARHVTEKAETYEIDLLEFKFDKLVKWKKAHGDKFDL
ncbi:MAG: hypothetical protein AAF311_05855 [Pseudomonadota bacterium]